MSEEKRRYERINNDALSVNVARPGLRGLFARKPQTTCTNFSRTGLQFDCSNDLAPGARVLIDVELENLSLNELKAEVISKKPLASGWCYGVRFCLEETRRADVFHALLMIENRLKSTREGYA